jgi:hypothetical protein
MTTNEATTQKPLWLSIEESFLELDPQSLSGGNLESSIQQIAGELDNAGYNVSKHGGNLLQLRWAMDDMLKVGRPLLKDVNAAVESFTLEDLSDAYMTVGKLIDDIGNTWPKLKESDRRAEVIRIVEETKLDLLIKKAKDLPGDDGIEMLIDEKVASDVIISSMSISEEKLKEVNEEMEKRAAERARVETLLEKVDGKSDEEKVKHLFDNKVSEKLMLEIAKVDQSAIDAAKKAMEEELKEQQRLAEEAAAKKKAEAEGPALEDISPEDMIDHIEAIREIMEFSDKEDEIRTMCEQSSLPKSLVDIAVSDPDKLDELEKNAEG